MKRLYAFIFALFICLHVNGQIGNTKQNTIIHWTNWQNDFIISLLLDIDDSMNTTREAEIKTKLAKLFARTEQLQAQNVSAKKLLEKVFHTVFESHLRTYSPLADFPQTIEKNQFGCVTGTLLFALVLEKLGFDYHIYETNYHVYLMVSVGEDKVLIETTDRVFGFEKNKHLIAKRIQEYQRLYDAKRQSSNVYVSIFKIEREISLIELIGLQYYNKATIAYNQKDYEKAMEALKKSMQLYDAERGTELMYLTLSQYLKNNNLLEEKKDKLLKYRDFYLNKLAAKIQSSK
ncbi:MAG: hypothetical protein OHK0057_15470 [Thermoflexibacter sp.]